VSRSDPRLTNWVSRKNIAGSLGGGQHTGWGESGQSPLKIAGSGKKLVKYTTSLDASRFLGFKHAKSLNFECSRVLLMFSPMHYDALLALESACVYLTNALIVLTYSGFGL
jgi:hypothetical protein